MRHFNDIACLSAFLLILHGFLMAAEQGHTGVLRGVVEDPSGKTIPGAEVKAVHEASQEKFKTLTDEAGKFEFTNLPGGDYTVSAEAQAFQKARKQATVGAADASPLRIRLQIAEMEQEVTITADSLAAPVAGENVNVVELELDWFRDLPVRDGDPAALASLFLDPAVSGASGAKIIVDGVEERALEVPTSSLKRVYVNKNPYGAEFGRPGKGRIEAITRDGSRHEFRGDLSFLFRNSALDARNAFAAVRPVSQHAVPEVQFNGPVVPDKVSFLLSGRRYIENVSEVINAATPAGRLVQNFRLPDRKTYLLGRLDVKFSQTQRMTIAYTFKNKSRLKGVGGFNLPERATDSFEQYNKLQVSQRSFLSPKALNEVRFAFKRETERTGGLYDRPALIVLDAFSAGGAQISQRLREKSADFQDIASLVNGKHNFRFGVGARPGYFRGRDAANFGGTFKFSSLAAFTDGSPFLFTVNQGEPEVRFRQHEFEAFFQDQIQVRRNFSLSLGLRYELQSNLNDSNNLAPRLAFAYSPGGGRTVVRAGAGIFYDRQPESVRLQSLLYDGFRIRQVVVSDPGFPDPFGPGADPSLALPSVVRIAHDIRNPYVIQGGVAVDRQLGKGRNFLTLEYTTIRGLKLYRTRNVNAPENGFRPVPAFVNVNQFESSGTSRGHSLSAMVRGRAGKDFDYISQYTLSRTTDDTGGLFSLPANNYDLRGERGLADFDRRHKFDFAGTYEFPWDLKLSAVFNAWSGTPFNITTGSDDNHDTVANDRPAGIGRNSGRGPGYFNVDLSIKKKFVLGPDKSNTKLELGLEAFNVFNRVNFDNFIGTLSSPFFGRANSAHRARELQVFLRFRFETPRIR